MSARTPVVGDWLLNITTGSIYVVVNVADRWWLINILTGRCYGGPRISADHILKLDAEDFIFVGGDR